MSSNTIFALTLSFLAGISTIIGAIMVFFSNNKNDKIITFALGFSAGVMICVSFTDLFPSAEKIIISCYGQISGLIITMFYMLCGMIFSLLIDKFIPKENDLNYSSGNEGHYSLFRVGVVTMIAITLHNFPEGIATFISSYQDTTLGISITIAIAMHNIPEGIAIAMPIYFATKSRFKAIKYSFLSGMAEPLGALIAFLCLKPFINELILGIIFAVVCGIMIYISLDELIPSSRKYGYTRLSVASIFLGISIMPITHLFV